MPARSSVSISPMSVASAPVASPIIPATGSVLPVWVAKKRPIARNPVLQVRLPAGCEVPTKARVLREAKRPKSAAEPKNNSVRQPRDLFATRVIRVAKGNGRNDTHQQDDWVPNKNGLLE